MRNIAIIGSGVTGLLAAHALRKAGHQVTVYSERTAEQWLTECRPTGTAARFDGSLALERQLGLAFWEEQAPAIQGVHLTFCPEPLNQLVTLTGRLGRPCLSIDVRLQSHRWTHELVARGGRVEHESVTVKRLEEIAASHELTLVAAGRAELSQLFERDAARSVHSTPPRHLTMVCVKGPRLGFEGVPLLPVKFNLLGPSGEAFWVPYFHKDVGPSWNCLFEAKPGGPMDRFQQARSGQEVVELGRQVIRELFPWDARWFEDAELADPNGWLVGKFTPTVRHPVGRLPSGGVVMPLGDTAMSLDPIAGQGANNGYRMVANLVACVAERGDAPFDEGWMRATFERFYTQHGHATYTFNNLLLEPLTPAGRALLIAQYGSNGQAGNQSAAQKLADAFTHNFEDPRTVTTALQDEQVVRRFIGQTTGGWWLKEVARGGAGVARAQLRQRLGLEPGHPRA